MAAVQFQRTFEDGVATIEARIGHPCESLLNAVDIEEQLERAVTTISARTEAFTAEASGWVVNQIPSFELNIAKLCYVGGGNYIPTPKAIVGKHAVLNIKTVDNTCFYLSILAHIYPHKGNGNNKPSKYKKYLHLLNITEKCQFEPVTIAQIPKFERMNEDISVTVVYLDEDDSTFYPIYTSRYRKRVHQVVLLLLHNPKTGKNHYTLIKNLSALLSSKSRHKGRVYVCPYCLHRFTAPHV